MVSIVLVLAIVAAVGVSFLQRQVREQFASGSGEVLSYEVTTGSISTTVSAGVSGRVKAISVKPTPLSQM